MNPAADAARSRVLRHVETLRETLPQPQFALLLRVLRAVAQQGGDNARLRVCASDRAHFTPLVRNEMLRTWTMVEPGALEDPVWLRQFADDLDVLLAAVGQESAALAGIAYASGLRGPTAAGGVGGA
ncbi:hypothetical protein GUY60_34760 [Streptomyces sp. YC537]|uniref:Uncharacterized protein n=1 Tax=Streptomyces boluensis TaxID=1775135 RepID=A0A964UY79_9ACTN|nr:hypothetical protein [Streptomyces boluensis]